MKAETLLADDSKERLAETLDRLAKGVRDPKEIKWAAEQMDRMREEIRQRCGTVNMAVDLIRDARNPGALSISSRG